jgi:hypothetical protein
LNTATLEKALEVPFTTLSEDETEREDAQRMGQFLARQDRWDELSARIRQAEQDRLTTSAGMPIADILAFGARSDVILAAEDALMDGQTSSDTAVLSGISALEEVLLEHRDDYAIALIVALTHIDIGWVWRGSGPEVTVPPASRQAFAAHFERAATILDGFSGIELNSPALAAAQCALLAGQRAPNARVADDYEDLIDLDPSNHRHMRAMGNHLLPRWFGTYAVLELEARRTAARTQDIWGNGGYTWVCFDAIAQDDVALSRVDVDFFVDGLKDILSRRPDQSTVNLLAAYCSTALMRQNGEGSTADLPRSQIAACAEWIIRDHLTEVHPLIWAHAAEGFDNSARITSVKRFAARGRAAALRVIGDLFYDEIANGRRVAFTPEGPKVYVS